MKNLFLPFLLLLLLGCTQQEQQEAHHAAGHNAPTELALNGTERWQADAATNANMQQLQQLMQKHLNQPGANAIEAVNELGRSMQLGFQEVFDECRMKGPEHDMLHVYLMPMLDDVKALETDDLTAATAARDRLAARLGQYQTYFK